MPQTAPVEDHPLIRELQRQIAQGFVEDKEGYFPKTGLHFEIDESELELSKKKIVYRISFKGDPFPGIDASGLKKLPSDRYQPLHNLVRTIVPLIGKGGEVIAPYLWEGELPDSGQSMGGPGWKWKNQKYKSLADGLRAYRYAQFKYTSDKGELVFSPAEPNDCFGDLEVSLGFNSLEDLDLKDVGKLAVYMDGLKRV